MTNKWVIYIPEEGHWPISGLHQTEAEARAAYLAWAERKRLPAGSHISRAIDAEVRVAGHVFSIEAN